MDNKEYKKVSDAELDYIDDKTAALLLNTPTSARMMLWVMVVFFICAIVWAAWAEIDKVTVGQGKVVPSSQVQVIQNLEAVSLRKFLFEKGIQSLKGNSCF
ncbi:ABC-type protease exporter membrane fusion protein (MFP) family component PrtE/AprE [Vibrio maritimus]|uniref:ABC-type protease exporter membrane fusion protein (MFP) family component PrtE/AprE n=1 Tax=Vibrio maritimus TaxID=990268 RepID=A0A090T683_9VIBR|nr:ABC-type protease exporter membrane fusion protein (MFP) family component PrtE/AprE [Vibrio maritimus]